MIGVFLYQHTVMQNQYYKTTTSLQVSQVDRGFRKAPLNITFGDIADKETQTKKVSTYTYQPMDINFLPDKHNFIPGEQMHIKSPKSLTAFAKINFNPRASSSSEARPSYETQQSDRPKYSYSAINVQNKMYEPLIPEMQKVKTAAEVQSHETLFSKFASSQSREFNREKDSKEFNAPKQQSYNFKADSLNFNQYGRFGSDNLNQPKKQYYVQTLREEINSDVQQYKKKIVRLEREVTEINFEKGELIIKAAELQRQNSDLKRQLRLKEENKTFSSPLTTPNTQNKKIEIDEDLYYEIQNIGKQQKQINKIKEEYIKLASAGYQNEIKKLVHHNNTLTLEIQSLKVELEMARQDLNQKQSKIEFLQRETRSLEQKSLVSSRMSVETNSERSSQVISLKHSLNSLENKYRAVSKQLASKQDYILKYITTTRRRRQDLQAIKDLVAQNESFNNSSSQVYSTILDSSKTILDNSNQM